MKAIQTARLGYPAYSSACFDWGHQEAIYIYIYTYIYIYICLKQYSDPGVPTNIETEEHRNFINKAHRGPSRSDHSHI